MKWNMGNLARQGTIGIKRRLYTMGLGGKHDVGKAAVLKVPHKALTRHHELLGLRKLAALGDILLERAGVDTDANRTARSAGGVDDGIDLSPIADITGIDAQLGGTSLDGADGELMVKVNIGNDWHRRLGTDGTEALERGFGGYTHAHDIAARLRQSADLPKRCLSIGGIGAGHRLDHDRRAAADLHPAHMHGARQLARQRMG